MPILGFGGYLIPLPFYISKKICLLKPGILTPLQHVPWLHYRLTGRGLGSLNKVQKVVKVSNRASQGLRKATPGLGKLGT